MKLSYRIPRFFARLKAVEDTIFLSWRIPNQKDRIFVVERGILQLQIEWDLFVRGVVLDSASGRFFDSNGSRITTSHSKSIYSREHASHILIGTYRKRDREPDWYMPKDAIDAADRLKVSNYNSIAGALGVSPWKLHDLRVIRNFVAHRSKSTAEDIRSIAWVPKGCSLEASSLVFLPAPGGSPQFHEWVNFMRAISRNMIS